VAELVKASRQGINEPPAYWAGFYEGIAKIIGLPLEEIETLEELTEKED